MQNATETNEEGAGASERARKPKTRVYSRYVLPSNRTPFSTHFDILKRFVTVSRAGAEGVGTERVEGEGVPVQSASMNVRFLRDIGLITPTERGKYVPTQDAIRFVNARSVSDERAKPILNALLMPTWFAETARTLFATQPIMTEDQFLGELAFVAQTDKEKEATALRVILEYLVYAGIVTRDERGLSMGSARAGEAQAPLPEAVRPDSKVGGPEKTGTETPGWHIVQTEDFYVKIRSDPAAVDDLADHLGVLRKKIQRLRPPEPRPEPSAQVGVQDLINSGSK